MSSENGETETRKLTSEELVNILAIAGRIDAQNKSLDAQSKLIAEDLHNGRHVYYAYSILDSLSSSYSMFKYFFDLAIAGTNDAMHDFMLTPAGIIGISIESLFLVTFSFLGCYFDNSDDEQNAYKRFITTAAIYLREVMKGLKNAYKGLRSALIAMHLLNLMDMRNLLAPAAILLGVFAAVNRSILCYIRETRKEMMKGTAALLQEIIKLESLSTPDLEKYYAELKQYHQSLAARIVGYAGVFLGGFIDGLYLYVGVLTLAALAPQLLLAMSIICAVYTLSCMVVRTYEEYEFQLKLEHARTKCELAMLSKQLETAYGRLLQLPLNNDDMRPRADLQEEIKRLIEQFHQKCAFYHTRTGHSLLTAFLTGIKNGLYAYGTLASVLFFVSTFLFLTGIAFPPALVVTSVVAGLVLLAGFTTSSLLKYYQHQPKNLPKSTAFAELLNLRESSASSTPLLSTEQFKDALKDGLTLSQYSSSTNLTNWFEVLRSLFSGLGKGQKFVDFSGNPLQEQGEDGHYHDTPVMYVLGVLSALLFGITLALRALARSLGRKPLGEVELLDVVKPASQPTTAVSQPESSPETTEYSDNFEEVVLTREPSTPPVVKKAERNDRLLSLFGGGMFAHSAVTSNLTTLSTDSCMPISVP